VKHEGRLERLFQTGHLFEAKIIADLRAIGCEVFDRNPENPDEQLRVVHSPWFMGSCDGVIRHVPGAEVTPHLLEIKTMNDKNYQDWKRRGVKESKPVYYAQMQVYLKGLSLTRALFVSMNKNTSEIEVERVHYDPVAAEYYAAKADRIAFASEPPEMNESFACRWCEHFGVCMDGGWSSINCRTCLHSQLFEDGVWRCLWHNVELNLENQKTGCSDHLFIPALVPGVQEDANEEEHTVTYRLPDGKLFIDGMGDKR
jgi:hypothetical protein